VCELRNGRGSFERKSFVVHHTSLSFIGKEKLKRMNRLNEKRGEEWTDRQIERNGGSRPT